MRSANSTSRRSSAVMPRCVPRAPTARLFCRSLGSLRDPPGAVAHSAQPSPAVTGGVSCEGRALRLGGKPRLQQMDFARRKVDAHRCSQLFYLLQ
mmetsp:Transcript_48360/g.122943  ORF Transcript_48360/g.122943 Transcript_48360/m.122943 type:complete len:95 (+) Transcript_48360:1053-1337(+)